MIVFLFFKRLHQNGVLIYTCFHLFSHIHYIYIYKELLLAILLLLLSSSSYSLRVFILALAGVHSLESISHSPNVTYWPLTQPSIKKQVHPVEDITLTCKQVEISAIATRTGSRWVSNNYITRYHRQFELVGVSCSWISSCSSR